MILLALAAWAGSVELTVDGIGKPVTQSQRLMLQSTLRHTASFYAAALNIHGPATMPVHVTVYSDRAAFEAVRAEKGAPPWSDGWFRRRLNAPPEAILWGGSTDGMRGIFLHETSHYLLSFAGRSPRWLNEGLAQVMETARVRGNVLTVTPTARHQQILAQLGRPTVAEIVAHPGGWSDMPAAQVGPLYISAWALTAMLLSTPEGKDTTAAILKAYRTNPSRTTVVAAIESTYPGGMDGLQKSFDRWAARPPRTLILSAPIQAAPAKSDALWIRCKDGRLANRSVGCGT